jgi:hypothetical protein
MAVSDGWEAAFVAMSVALGASVDQACASLGEEAAAKVAPYARTLVSPSREARAKALATGLARIALAIEEARLA